MYRIREQYWDRWGSDVNERNCMVSCNEIEELATIWGIDVMELMGQVEEIPGNVARDFIDQSYHYLRNSTNGSVISGHKAVGDVARSGGADLPTST